MVFYVLADLLSYNIRRSKEITECEKEKLLLQVERGTISIENITRFGNQPTEPIESEYLSYNYSCYYDDNCEDDYEDDYEREEERREEEKEQERQRQEEEDEERSFEDLCDALEYYYDHRYDD